MIIVRTSGGLGNQLFQYATGRALALRYHTSLKIDNSIQKHLVEYGFKNYRSIIFRPYILDCFTIDAEIVNQNEIPWYLRNYFFGFLKPALDGVRRRFLSYRGREKKPFVFDSKILSLGSNVYLDGDWQSYRYFEDYQKVLRKDFSLRNDLPEHVKKLEKEIQGKQSLCIHVRRGDYVNNSFHNVVPIRYYETAMDEIQKKVNIEHVYIFSDDISWCKKNIKTSVPVTIVDDTFSLDHGVGHFWLMRQCKYFIIANSTFSWWAAWLAEYSKKIVVAPKKWVEDENINTNDLCPPDWVRL